MNNNTTAAPRPTIGEKAQSAISRVNNTQSTVAPRKASLEELIKSQSPGFKMALPKDFDADRFTRIAITAIKNNPKLMDCDPYSILGGLMLAAQLGLEPNSPLHEASLIPYKNKAEFQIEYRGYLKLVWNSGLVSYLDYDKICQNDEYEYQKGFEYRFWHKPRISGDRGPAIAYYAMAEIKGGGKVLTIMSKDEVLAFAKRFSKTYNSKKNDFSGSYGEHPGPWDTDFDSMAIKTVLKQLADKKLPKRTTNEALRFAQAVGVDESVANIQPADIGKSIDMEQMEIARYEVLEEIAEGQQQQVNPDTGEVSNG